MPLPFVVRRCLLVLVVVLAPAPRAFAQPSVSPPPAWGSGPRKPQPLREHLGRAEYKHPGGKLYHARVKVSDVEQGRIGNCGVAAAAAAVAHQRPDLVKSAFSHHSDGSLSVRVFEPWTVNGKRVLKPMSVHVTREVPTMDGEVLYARGRNPRRVEQWPALMEKAFAGSNGVGYKGIVGVNPADAMEAITGQRSTRVSVHPRRAEELYTAIRGASRARKPMATFTFPESVDLKERLAHADPTSRALFEKLDASGRSARHAVYGEATGVVANHAYTVLGVSEQGGQKVVHLRNPWGQFSPSKEGYGHGVNPKGSGIFTLPLGVFATLFHELAINEVPPPPAPSGPERSATATRSPGGFRSSP